MHGTFKILGMIARMMTIQSPMNADSNMDVSHLISHVGCNPAALLVIAEQQTMVLVAEAVIELQQVQLQ